MTKETLQKQADRADSIANQAVDDELKKTLRDAARDYRRESKQEECALDPKWKLPKEIS
jgi:hypothetical protein